MDFDPTFFRNRPKQAVCSLLPPPRTGDRLFVSSHEWQTNACPNPFSDGSDYRTGYRTAALWLAQISCEERDKLDIWIYPIVFLYRHHIELTLKAITLTATAILGPKKKYPSGHVLLKLWSSLRPLLNAVCNHVGHETFPEEDLEGVEFYIAQLHRLDEDGQRFRYQWRLNRSGVGGLPAWSLPASFQQMNMRIFATGMEILADYLDGIDRFFDQVFQDGCMLDG